MKKKVVLGMSGGVDSSVCAHLLIEQGYEVIGVFMQNWDPALNGDLADPYIDKEVCQAQEDFLDAKNVADQLGIQIEKVDFVGEYWDKVFLMFLEEYKKGRTPNPDILCNKYIKFRSFLDYAQKKYNPDYIAMGHYAQVEHNPVKLIRGKDQNKDQTYFLEQLNKEQLSKTLFPIGHLEKSQVRKIAEDIGLSVAKKKDSTGICFIGERNFTQFLTSYIPTSKGDILDIETNKKIGEHNGLMFYTIGQRKGLGIGGLKDFENVKWYVCQKDLENNILYVSNTNNKQYLYSNRSIIKNINWIREDKKEICSVKFRYRSEDVKVVKYKWLNNTEIEMFYETTEAVTPGQAAVFYNEEECLGGGEIDAVYLEDEKRAII